MNEQLCDPLATRELLVQFEQTQWMSRESLQASQFLQIGRLLQHAYETVPFYRERFDNASVKPTDITPETWHQVPILSRRDIQFAGPAMHSQALPAGHRVVGQSATSGSTGRPMLSLSTDFTQLFWNAITLRDHLWHRRDFSQKFGAIRALPDSALKDSRGHSTDNWGTPTVGIVKTGSASVLDIHHTIDQQAMWLEREAPAYLLTHPSNAIALARYWAKAKKPLNLREIGTFGESLDPELRTVCGDVWGAPVVDVYSAGETGYLALQCPEATCYHVQAESVFLEVLDDEGRACEPGQMGRVVVTVLTNYAMPLIRYEIGDYAVVGEGCPCGRTLPVLERIVGRQRNLCILPDGRRRWPSLNTEDAVQKISEFPPIQQFQVVQRTRDLVELLLVMHRCLSEAEERLVRHWVHEALGHPFEIAFTYRQHLERSASGKFEDFRCEVLET